MTEPDEGRIVEHDRLAEEADLLTIREARARIIEELRILGRQVAALERVPSAGADLTAARARRDHLERALARFSAGPSA